MAVGEATLRCFLSKHYSKSVERFNGTVLDEFFRVKLRETFYDSVEALLADLDDWLLNYNTERSHLVCRNMGRRPIETIISFVCQED